jgi:type VI secretion system protein ImpH
MPDTTLPEAAAFSPLPVRASPSSEPERRSRRSAYARLLEEPRHFRFDAALRVLARAMKSADVAESVRFHTPPGVGYAAADVTAVDPPVEGAPAKVTTPVMTLTGPTGVLPHLYTETLTTTLRNRSRALYDFFDTLSHRTIAFFARAGIKYRINRAAETAAHEGRSEQDAVTQALLALTGYATPHLAPRLAVGVEPLLHYSGFFSGHPRSADRLAALTSDWLGRKVEIVQFVGAWLPLSPDQRSRFSLGRHPGAWNRLGIDAAAGVRAWDPQARIILRIGPLDRASFAALMPDHPGLQRLVSLVRAYLGFETGFAVNPVLSGSEIPPLLLDPSADPPPRLGWNTWVPAPPSPVGGVRRGDAYDAIFEAEIVEAEEAAGRAAR